jgi:4-diphosphocytidyl-2-C-methyl-D-erythritol kinase
MALELIAPAKLNLTLEVTGRRPDGYHDLVTVMQTIDLADRVWLEEALTLEIELSGDYQLGVPIEGPRNLAFKAAQALAAAAGIVNPGARMRLEKNIPAGMGLGGGSTDAAAVLRGLCALWRLDISADALNDVAASVGSDVPFFLHGGAALVTGRGEFVEPLPDGAPLSLTLFGSDIEIEDKTRRMYSSLAPADFTDGRRGHVMAESIRRGLPIAETDLYNAFDRHIGAVAEPLAQAMALCREAGLAVIASGSGPSFFAPVALDTIPTTLLHQLQNDWGVRAIACRSLTRAEATAMREV